ncbi:FNTB [Symbiodinium sp. CCMP2592]|nr:FNTB [Symbiodinium sp. CCMP2592]
MMDGSPSVQLECEDTLTSEEQQCCEENVLNIFQHALLHTKTQELHYAAPEKISGLRLVQGPPTPIISCSLQEEISLQRERHVNWLPPGSSLFRQQPPWFVFWISHALEILDDFSETLWSPQVLIQEFVAGAIAVASMLHLLTDELLEGVPEYIRRCQTWEGGIAGEEGLEAHGGYSYCGLAALCIAGRADALDLHAFLKWAVYKQMTREGGFQGRANKLVDSCYSFWQGAIFPLLHEAFRQRGEEVALPKDHCWFAPQPLQTYILLACQHPNGGLRDKPGKSADFYHTCYALSGMAVSQYDVQGGTAVFGDRRNLLERTDIYYNVAVEKADRKCAYFNSLPPLSVDGRTVHGREGSGAVSWRQHIRTIDRQAEQVDDRQAASSATYTARKGGYAGGHSVPRRLQGMALWEIVGGSETGGIVVRQGRELKSTQEPERLATKSLVEELELVAERLHYRLQSGRGPQEGWISIRISGKELAVRRDEAGPTNGAPPKWVEESAEKMRAFREGRKMLPPPVETPERLLHEVQPKDMLPPFKRLSPKEMAEMSVKSLPGHFSGLQFPHNVEGLKSCGPSWYTQAFHKFGTLPSDNSVVKVLHVEQLPHSGFDAAGGAGHKALIELQYAKPDPNLHTKLFAKYPWDYFESETGKRYRMQMSAYQDMDSAELLTSICCEHLFPFRIPKLYFADINRETTNYVLIVERIPFGRRGKVVKGKVTEKIERKPFEILPVCGKYQDYLLEDAPSIYYALFREMAHLAAWDHQGRYDSFLGPMQKYTEQEYLDQVIRVRKPQKQKKFEVLQGGCRSMIEKGIDFALNVASQIFTASGRDKAKLEKMKKEIVEIAPYFDDIRSYMSNSSDWTAAMHMNLQADNAWFWHDEMGDLDIGVFDWCGFQRAPFVMNFMGCLSGADADLLDAHEEGLMKMFCAEYERYGGPHLEPSEMLLKYHLQWPSFAMDACQWVDRDIYVQCPREEWSTIKSMLDDKFVDRWNVRCRGTTLVNAFEFWHRRNFSKIFNDWISGPGKDYRSVYSA